MRTTRRKRILSRTRSTIRKICASPSRRTSPRPRSSTCCATRSLTILAASSETAGPLSPTRSCTLTTSRPWHRFCRGRSSDTMGKAHMAATTPTGSCSPRSGRPNATFACRRSSIGLRSMARTYRSSVRKSARIIFCRSLCCAGKWHPIRSGHSVSWIACARALDSTTSRLNAALASSASSRTITTTTSTIASFSRRKIARIEKCRRTRHNQTRRPCSRSHRHWFITDSREKRSTTQKRRRRRRRYLSVC